MNHHPLPIGFKFLPRDEVVVDFYLRGRVEGSLSQQNQIMELDVYAYTPETIFGTFLRGRVEGYFFTKRGRKHDKGKVANRVAGAGVGFWKATGVEVVRKISDGSQIGIKTKLKYFQGTNSRKDDSDWLMHEYQMTTKTNEFQEIVVCKIYNKFPKKIENSEVEATYINQLNNELILHTLDELAVMPNRLQIGFKFVPTEEQLIDLYLRKRIEGYLPRTSLFLEVDVYACRPDILLAEYSSENDEGYFFTRRARKYATGNVVKREAVGGFWKMTSSEISINRNSDGCLIGKKHVLKFFRGTNSEKQDTAWLMHEYEMVGNPDKFQDVVLCKIYRKAAKKMGNQAMDFSGRREAEPLVLQQYSHTPAAVWDNDDDWVMEDLTFDPDVLDFLAGID